MSRSEMKVIGGSTIAGILDKSPHDSPYSTWLKLTSQLPPTPANEAMTRGNALEPVVAMMYGANHPEYAVETMGVVQHPEYPYIVGSPDRVLIENGELVAGLEIKTANIVTRNEWGDEETDEVPDHYWAQCQWYAGLLNLPVWYLAVGFVPAERRKIITYREYEVRLNADLYNKMIRKAVRFWTEHVETRTPPPITKPDAATIRYLKSKYPKHDPDKWLEPTDELNQLASELLVAKSVFDEAEKTFELRKTQMIAALGDAEGFKSRWGNFTYRASKPMLKTDWKAVSDALAAPREIIDQFTKEVPGSRRFLLPHSKGE